MSSDPTVTPPPVDASEPLPGEHPYVHFSRARWFSTGIVRVLYRGWTRIAAHLFPEESQAELFHQLIVEPARRILVVVEMIVLQSQANLSHVVGAHDAIGGFARLLNRGHEQSHQERNDADDDQ